MIKSMYVRLVLTFLGSVIGGTLLAYAGVNWAYRDQLNENLQITLLDFGQDVVRIYEAFPLPEVDRYVSGTKQFNSYYVRIYDGPGQFHSYHGLEGHDPVPVTREQVESVLRGGQVQVETNGINPILVGLPLHTDAGMKALFVERRAPNSAAFVIKWVSNFLLYALLAGSVLILVSAMFLVKPIKKLTEATKRIAGGDFNVKLNIRQKGELGVLARSFEDMMHDLQRLEQMRREFVSNVSHEIQSPLTSISGYALALKQINLTDSERSRYLDIIIAESGRMSKMSDSLLKLSLLESQSRQMQYTAFSLDEQMRRVIVALEPQWSARHISFDLDLKPVRLTADADLLSQVWTNIIVNGIKFSADGGVMKVSLKPDIKHVTVRISDTGIGISPEDQKRVFERFFKADRSHSLRYSGSGMGLAIVKQIISLHQGDIRVESELGRGTTFTVVLPLAPPAESMK